MQSCGGAVGLDLVLERSDLGGARGQDQILRRDGVDDIGGREALGLQRLQIQIDLHLTLLAAVGIWNARAVDGDQLRADEVQAVVVELLLRQTLAGETELDDGNAGGAVLKDERRRGAGRQLAQLRLRDGGDLRDRDGDVDLRLEEDLDDRRCRSAIATRYARCR